MYGYQPLPAKATGLPPTHGGASIATAHRSKDTGDSEGEVDPFLRLAEECVGILSEKIASGGGVWPVDVLPSLQYIPEWVPGGGFKRSAREWKKKMEEFVDKPYEFVKSSLVCFDPYSMFRCDGDGKLIIHTFMQKSGNYKPSLCSMLLEDESMHGGDRNRFEFDLKWSANSMYSASMDAVCPIAREPG